MRKDNHHSRHLCCIVPTAIGDRKRSSRRWQILHHVYGDDSDFALRVYEGLYYVPHLCKFNWLTYQ